MHLHLTADQAFLTTQKPNSNREKPSHADPNLRTLVNLSPAPSPPKNRSHRAGNLRNCAGRVFREEVEANVATIVSYYGRDESRFLGAPGFLFQRRDPVS